MSKYLLKQKIHEIQEFGKEENIKPNIFIIIK